MDVAALRALSDDELIRRHDAIAAEQRDATATRSTVYLDELRARVAEQQARAILRTLYAILLLTGVVLVAVIITMIVVG